MNSSELMLFLGKAIAGNQEIATWATGEFLKEHETYIGVDFEEPPDETHYPIVILYNVQKGYGATDREIFSVEIGIGLMKEELVKPDTAFPNLYSYTGLLLLSNFRELVELVILKSARELHAKISIQGEAIPDVFYPLFSASITANIEIIRGYRAPY